MTQQLVDFELLHRTQNGRHITVRQTAFDGEAFVCGNQRRSTFPANLDRLDQILRQLAEVRIGFMANFLPFTQRSLHERRDVKLAFVDLLNFGDVHRGRYELMPPLGPSTVDHTGVALIRAWITHMPEDKVLAEPTLIPMMAYRDAVSGGDTELGTTVFHKIQKCIACHGMGAEGGRVGPDFSHVGKRTKPEYLLESVVTPSAKFVKGFETPVVNKRFNGADVFQRRRPPL